MRSHFALRRWPVSKWDVQNDKIRGEPWSILVDNPGSVRILLIRLCRPNRLSSPSHFSLYFALLSAIPLIHLDCTSIANTILSLTNFIATGAHRETPGAVLGPHWFVPHITVAHSHLGSSATPPTSTLVSHLWSLSFSRTDACHSTLRHHHYIKHRLHHYHLFFPFTYLPRYSLILFAFTIVFGKPWPGGLAASLSKRPLASSCTRGGPLDLSKMLHCSR